MKILVACEESQRVTIALRDLGHDAFSCDLMDCSGGHPEWHIKGDAIMSAYNQQWDMILAFPTCTYLTVSANKWYKDQPERKSGTLVGAKRRTAREEAINFFMLFVNAPCDKIAIENPVGVMSTRYRKPDQIIQPYNFGSDASKQTCLWLKGLPLLVDTEYIEPRITKDGKKRWSNQTDKDGSDITPPSPERAKIRSKTFPGVAQAMAYQWGRNT